MLDVGPDTEHHLAGLVLAVDHRRELFVGRLRVLVAVWTGLAGVLHVGELALWTGASVGPAQVDQFASVFVVGLHAVARFDDLVGLEAEVVDGFEDGVVGVEVRPLGLGVGVVEPDHERAVVHVLVGPDDGGHPCVAEVPRAVGVRGRPHPDLVVRLDVGEVREHLVVLLVLGLQLGHEVGVEFFESLAAFLGRHAPDPADDGADDLGYLVAVLAELGVFAHQRAHDGTHLRVAVVFQRVEEGVLLGLLFHSLADVVVHWASVLVGHSKQVRFGRRLSSSEGNRLAVLGNHHVVDGVPQVLASQ